jgi:hypothetical protein
VDYSSLKRYDPLGPHSTRGTQVDNRDILRLCNELLDVQGQILVREDLLPQEGRNSNDNAGLMCLSWRTS